MTDHASTRRRACLGIAGATLTATLLAGCGGGGDGDAGSPKFTGNVAPTFTAQPANQTVVSGSAATFEAAATGNPTPSYQWQLSIDGGQTYSPIDGATGTSYTTGVNSQSNSGAMYELVATNSVGTATSNAATLTVTGGP